MHSNTLENMDANPLPPVNHVADTEGVGPQNAPSNDAGVPHTRATPVSPDAQDTWPAWAPPLPTETVLAPWEIEGRPQRPDEQFHAFGEPARNPTDYQLPQGLLGDSPGAEAMTHGMAVRSLLFSAGFPATEGSALLHELADAARANPGGLDDLAFQEQAVRTEMTLRRSLGNEEFDRQREALTSLIAEMDRKSGGKLREFIEEHADHLASPLVYTRLLAHAGRVRARQG